MTELQLLLLWLICLLCCKLAPVGFTKRVSHCGDQRWRIKEPNYHWEEGCSKRYCLKVDSFSAINDHICYWQICWYFLLTYQIVATLFSLYFSQDSFLLLFLPPVRSLSSCFSLSFFLWLYHLTFQASRCLTSSLSLSITTANEKAGQSEALKQFNFHLEHLQKQHISLLPLPDRQKKYILGSIDEVKNHFLI